MILAFSISGRAQDDRGGDATSDSVSASVADAVEIVRASGLANETNAMFTNVEGEWDEIMAVVKQCIDRVAEGGARVAVTMKLDYRPGHDSGELARKPAKVQAHLDARSSAPEDPSG